MSLYDRLRGITLDNLTQTELKSVLDGVSIDGATAGDAAIAANVYAAKAVQSGLTPQCIQDAGDINVTTLSDASPIKIEPSGETWRVIGVHAINNDGSDAAIVALEMIDAGGTAFTIVSKSLAAGAEAMLDLSSLTSNLINPQVFFRVSAGGAGTINIAVSTAYQVVQQ